ncbi:MAG: SprT-like domain-containing protein [Bryobacteraceae bacterium]|nr:SprT-like domain-containing protein [Bryobacteraceae bacterium]
MQVESRTLEETARRIFAELKPRTAPPDIRVEFRAFTSLCSRIRLREGRIMVRISHLLREAPTNVIESLLWILLAKLYRKPIPADAQECYREFVNREELRQDLVTLRQTRGRKRISAPQGLHYDLTELFDAVNAAHFAGQVSRPKLGWSQHRARTMLGQYDPHHHLIVLSSLLDHAHVPREVVEYVMYHEMLHIQIPVIEDGPRRSIHPPEFRAAERRFPAYAEAKAFLKRLPGSIR